MWAELVRHLAEFESAVLTWRDPDGYPFSVRCRPRPEVATETLHLDLGPGLPLQPGPASVLCHRHDAQLWSQKSFLVRGRLEQTERGSLFRPVQLIPGAGIGGVLGLLRFVVSSRRAAARYLAARDLARPRIPWSAINAVKHEVEAAERLHPDLTDPGVV